MTALPMAFLKRDAAIAVSYKIAFVLQLSSIFVAVPLFFFMGKLIPAAATDHFDSYGGNYFAFLLIGVAFVDYLAISLRTFNQSLRESQLMGTLEIVLLSPTSLTQLLIYSSLWVYLLTTVRFLLYLLLGWAFGLELGHANLFGAVLVLALSIPAFASLGIITASATLVIKRGELLTTALSGASLVLGGVLFPVALLPPWLQAVAQLLPVVHALEAMRLALFSGAGLLELWRPLLVLLVFAAVLLPVSLYSFWLAVRMTKRSGTLAHY